MKKIFGIGFHKTGTRSLHYALTRVGINSIHWPFKYENQINKNMSHKEILEVLAPCLKAYEGFNDVPFPTLYAELERIYPNSKFILTERDSESWWQSLISHWYLLEKTYLLASFELIQYNSYEPYITKATLNDKDIFINKFEKHNQTVRHYFANRPDDLLIINWKNGEYAFSWEKLCSFLKVDMPEDKSVPHYRGREIVEWD
ncbi:MAG: hypothetical protein F6K54_17090 [Okeania sp. SIO3B5]|uniref:sulfotransferase n=1 Tax=Okeania sp. SIO3B5 TaxID=2607811 RepID=UPI0013FFC1E4|nr:sulfotransferase [Okeania sp. SIO3B5]NEO54644.1 hypothetical protein [Okeania sp. SIO3B5]